MKNNDHSPFQDFGDHPVFDDKDLFQKMWKGPFIVGRMDKVFVPTREELLVLFKHWYEAAKTDEYYLQWGYSYGDKLRCDYKYRRLNLIEKFLPEEEVNAVIEQLRERQRELQKTRGSDGGKSDEQEQPPQPAT